MAKKTTTLRVHKVAKELGVSSKDIVAKCKAEGIADITNHMSAVSLGLAQTVKEWFADTETKSSTTAVETAAPVDVKKARAKVKKTTRKKVVEESEEPAKATTIAASSTPTAEPELVAVSEPVAVVDDAVEVEPEVQAVVVDIPDDVEPAVEPEVVEEPQEELVEPEVAASAVDSASSGEPEMPDSPPAEEDAGEAGGESPVMNIPSRPDKISPVGPKLEQPKKVSLAGPKVIRVEEPDRLPQPRSRNNPAPAAGGGNMMSNSGPRRGGGASGMPMQQEYGGGRGGGGGGGGRRGGGAGVGGAGNAKGRSPRRSDGRTGRSGMGEAQPFKPWREQDMVERNQALKHSSGFFKAHRQDRLRKRGGQRAVVSNKPTGPVKVSEPITIKELSAATGVKGADIVKQLFLAGTPATINSVIESDQAIEIMLEHDIELVVEEAKSAADIIEERFETRTRSDERGRAPVVTILGHVDHGKTSLLDAIRKTEVAAGEAGGITQATSAFQVPVTAGDKDRVITFIDTPGHEAFTAMRARGAKITDIAVLVVAADDGVMPQTEESISHAKAAGVPIVVALNKTDRPDATEENIQRILGQLAERELNPTEWGGSTEVVRTSAINGDGIQDLLDTLDYQAELLDLKADFEGNAEGTVLESQIEEGRGPVARMLVQEGLLKRGGFVVVGRGFGRVRDIVDDHGKRIEQADPSTPVAISGIDVVPDAGDRFFVVDSLKEAEHAASERRRIERERELVAPKVTLDNIFDHIEEGRKKDLPLVVKGDVQGSVETLQAVLGKIGSDEVKVSVKHAAVGGVNESDVTLAEATGAIVIGFNVTTTAKSRQLAEGKGVDIRLYDVIYDITDDVRKAAAGLLDPELKLEVIGHAEVREVFKISKVGAIAGCYVTDGNVERNAQIRVTRDGIVVEKDRRLEQLKRFKDDAKEVKSGMECGMKIDGYDDIKAGDVLECYKTIEIARTL